jgi:hypothetical protein
MPDEIKEEKTTGDQPTEWEQTGPETEEEESYGMISKIIGVFIEPSKAFKYIAKRPEIWGPILASFVLMLIVSFFTMDKLTEMTLAQTAEQLQSQGMTDEQIEQATKVVAITMWFTPLTQTLAMAFIWLIIGGVAYFIGLFLGQDSSYKSSLAVVAYASIPAIVIKQVVISTIVLLSGSFATTSEFQMAMMKASLSLYSLFGNTNMNVNLQSALVGIDIFTIWSLFLMAIGFKYANKVKMSHAWRTSIILTVVVFLAMIPLTSLGLKAMIGE